MMRHALALALVVGCGGSLPQPETATVVQQPVTAQVLSAAGDTAVLTLAVVPARLPEFVGQGTFLQPELQALVDQFATDAAVFNAWLGDATRHFREGDLVSVLDWPGLDLTRPIFFRMGEAPDELQSALAVLAGGLSPLRHVLACPATDPVALQANFESMFTRCTLSGGLRQCGERQVQIVHNADWVFVVQDEDPSPAVSASDLMAPPDPLAEWAYASGPIAAFVRAPRIRGAAAHFAAGLGARAIASADPESAGLLRTMAASEIVGAYLRSSPYGSELTNMAFVLQASPLRLSFRASLSEDGAHYSQAPVGEANRGGNAEFGVLIRTSSPVEALLGAARQPFGYPTAERAMNSAMRSCGIACVVRGVFEPSAYLPFLLGGSSPTAALSALAELEVAPSLDAGTFDVDVNVNSSMIPMGRDGARMSIRSRFDVRSWSGGLSFDAEGATSALVLARSAPDTDVLAQDDGRDASLACLNGLGQHVTMSLEGLAQAPDVAAQARESVMARAAELGRCANDPVHAADRDGYLSALAFGVDS
ncbi:MAG: hypothetical protein ACI9KE_004018 [Polyangiales bacterium]|jgi:hypothetical protein